MQTSLLVTEWPASEKADLEALMYEGRGVAVAFSGCQMRVLPQCRLPGHYTWQRTTPGADYIEITNEQDLFAKLPLGAFSLSGELKRSGSLTIQTTVAGQVRLVNMTAADVPYQGECAQATHVVNAISLGAFVLTAGGGSVKVEAGVGNAGGSGSRSQRVVRSAGDANACYQTTDEGPQSACASPIQVFLSAIPGRTEALGPPGSVKVDFVSASATTRWDIYVDDQATCTTPCSRWVDPTRPLVLRARDLPDRLQLRDVTRDSGPLQVSAAPKSMGPWVTGIVFTAFGGMGVVTGISLIWLLLDSGPKLRVRPLFETDMRAKSFIVGPGFVAGTF
jgi:hypothetical protein